MKSLSRSFVAITTLAIFSSSTLYAQFNSAIFTYDDSQAAKGLHAFLKGESSKGCQWAMHEVQEQHIPFYQGLFSNSEVMKNFGERQIRGPRQTKERVENFWLPRFQKGQPHGGMTVFNPADTAENYGHIVAGGGDAPGVSEVAYAYMPSFWGKGIGSGVLSAIVHEWAPEVRRIGLGTGLDEIQDLSIIQAFRCFGDETLKQIDATASPVNKASWHMLDQESFEAAVFKVEDLESIPDFSNRKELSPEELETEIFKLFDPQFSSEPLEGGKRYRLVDCEGKLRTFSKNLRFNQLKYHFEHRVD